MTAQKHTPYDAEEESFQEWLRDYGGEKAILGGYAKWNRAWHLGRAEGYRLAKAEDAALLEAVKDITATLDCVISNPITAYEIRIAKEAIQRGRAAIAATEPAS